MTVRRMFPVLRALAFLGPILLLLPTACQTPTAVPPTPLPADFTPAAPVTPVGGSDLAPVGGGKPVLAEPTPGVRFRLSEAEPSNGGESVPQAAATPLDDAAVKALLARLPVLPEAAAQPVKFALRPGPKPPAVTGNLIQAPFPPPTGVPKPAAADREGPLDVVRFSPEGDVPLAPNLSLTFSQPMVPLTSHTVLSNTAVPVRLSPSPNGQWRWAGTRTLLFEPDGRFPMATEFTVVVPAGAKSMLDGVLVAEKKWTFRTPPPTVVEFHPTSGPVVRQPIIALRFDQRIAAEAVLAKLKVSADRTDVALRLATAAEIEGDERLSGWSKDEDLAGRWLAVVPAAPLPVGAHVTAVLGPGVPSAEGPRVSEEAESFEFDVYGPLRVAQLFCGGVDSVEVGTGAARIRGCNPLDGWTIQFNNALDEEAFDPATVEVQPEIPGLKVSASSSQMSLRGLAVGRTTYAVKLPAALKDIYGQTLGPPPVTVTFETGDADPLLFAPGDQMVVLDPAAGGRFGVQSVNNPTLHATLYAVQPADWPAFQRFASDLQSGGPRPLLSPASEAKPGPPGKEVWSGELHPPDKRDALVTTAVDLGPALKNGVGQVVLVVESPNWSAADGNWANRPVARWIQATRLAVDVFADRQKVLAWVTSLADGRPVAGATVTLTPGGATATTDAGGLAELPAIPKVMTSPLMEPERVEDVRVVVRQGDDQAFQYAYDGGSWFAQTLGKPLTWHVFADRGIYKPGEAVHVKGYLRRVNLAKGGDLEPLGQTLSRLRYQVTASNGEVVLSGTLAVGPLGSFDATLGLPKDIELGYANLQMAGIGEDIPYDAWSYATSINVAEFRRPEFEVTAQAGKPYYLLGDRGEVTAQAAYYSGGGLSNAETRWSVSGSPTRYAPPGHDDFEFGLWQPWWPYEPFGMGGRTDYGGRTDFGGRGFQPFDSGTVQTFEGRTDATGRHVVGIDFEGVTPRSPIAFQAEASVQDVNRQAWSGRANFLVHPSTLYVGLRPSRWFVEAGKAAEVDVIVTNIDGELQADRPVAVVAERLEWAYKKGRFEEQATPAGRCDVTSLAKDPPAHCTLNFEEGGTYRISATVADSEGRENLTRLQLWVAGPEPTVRDEAVQQQRVQLIPNAETYAPGDTAEVLVQAPFVPSEALILTRRSGIVKTERLHLSGATTTLRIPILEGDVPGLSVQVDLVGAIPREGSPAGTTAAATTPAYATGTIDLAIPPRTRTLAVEVVPQSKVLRPAGKTVVDVRVTGADGKPLQAAEVTLVAVDEAVLALTDYHIPDPLGAFYPARDPGVEASYLRGFLRLQDLPQPQAEAANEMSMSAAADSGLADGDLAALQSKRASPLMAQAPGPATGGGGPDAPVVPERTNFDPLAAFLPGLTTDADGRVSAEIQLPDSVTRYRITAIATDGAKRFGMGESSLTAQLPLTVRPSAPRFLNYGDAFELPIVVQNQTDSTQTVDVAIRTVNLTLTAGAGRRFQIPAGDRLEVRFPAAAAYPGTAVFQAGAFAVGDTGLADAQRVSLPVWTPATTEAFATYGEVDSGAIRQAVQRPPEVIDGFGGLELTTASTALGNLTDAFIYLQTYPYECAEQISSRLMGTVTLKDVLRSFNVAELPGDAEIQAAVERDLSRLQALQEGDGGFAWWVTGRGDDPFLTVHVTHALARTKAKGYAIPESMLEQAQAYLKDIASHLNKEFYSPEARRSIRAYALYVRALLGDRDTQAARTLFHEDAEPPIDQLGWLLSVLAGDAASTTEIQAIRRQLANRATEEAGTAQFTTGFEEMAGHTLLASDRRSDAIVIDALMADDPESDLIPKVVRGLLAHRVKGRWNTTQENAWVLLALERYFRTYEQATPDFTARAWLGDGLLTEAAFKGRSADRNQVNVPMANLPPAADVTLSKTGEGRLYYRLGLRYAPTNLTLDPLERGFSVLRSYEAVDDPADVKVVADGSWQVRAGSRVRVRLTLTAEARRYHVALVDPLPAGLEAQNPELNTTGDAPPAETASESLQWWSWRWWNWYDHQAFRDERTEVFSDLLDAGVYTYDYIALATTPGTFVVPPAHAEELYQPETFGRSGSSRMVIR